MFSIMKNVGHNFVELKFIYEFFFYLTISLYLLFSCPPNKFPGSATDINIIKMFVAITLLSKELMTLLRREKCNFIEQNY